MLMASCGAAAESKLSSLLNVLLRCILQNCQQPLAAVSHSVLLNLLLGTVQMHTS